MVDKPGIPSHGQNLDLSLSVVKAKCDALRPSLLDSGKVARRVNGESILPVGQVGLRKQDTADVAIRKRDTIKLDQLFVWSIHGGASKEEHSWQRSEGMYHARAVA